MSVPLVSNVGDQQASPVAPSPSKKKNKFTKGIEEVGPFLEAQAKIGETTRSMISCFKKVSPRVVKVSTLSNVSYILLSPVDALESFKQIQKLWKKASVSERVRAAARLLIASNSLGNAVAAACTIIHYFKPTAERLVKWIPIFDVINFFVSFLSLFELSESVWKRGRLTYKLNKLLPILEDPAIIDLEKAKELQAFLRTVQEKDIKRIFAQLDLPVEAEVEKGSRVRDKIVALVKNTSLGQEVNVAEAKDLMKKLSISVRLQLGSDVQSLALTIAELVGTGLSIFAPPLAPVGFIILASTGVISLILTGGRFLLMSKNPFDPASKSRAKELVENISEAITQLSSTLKSVYTI